MTKQKGKDKDFWFPDDEMEELAKCLLPAIRKFYESEKGQLAFKEWEASRKQLKENDPAV